MMNWALLNEPAALSFFVHSSYKDLRHGTILFYTEPERARIYGRIRQLKRELDFKLGFAEAYQIYRTVQATAKITGALAEVGCFEGGSTRLICEAKGDRTLHVFDTFEGLPEVTDRDSAHFKVGMYRCSAEAVQANVGDWPLVSYHQGVFPEATGEVVLNEKFSFVHLDVDTYFSTRNCLEFFYPRMTPGGVILSHDYVSSSGVQQAFDEFFADKPEIILEPAGSQALIVKL